MLIAPVPKNVRALLHANTHPGLLLDKYVESADDRGATGDFSGSVQKPAVEKLVILSQVPPDGLDWQEITMRRALFLDAIGAVCSPCVTSGPLTLHLARASALENAGICLHPIYGFTYLPGSGVKGLARAYAETVAKASDADIEAVFGITDSAGTVAFHDAWPTQWPRLVADILNNHHKDYYGAKEDDNAHPPGDWEEPNMVSFLAVPAGVTFDFPLSKRRPDAEFDRPLKLAREWLLGGLIHLGAGAKTAAGYGAFRPTVGAHTTPALGNRQTFAATLELVTPAFLAGSYQDRAEYCELRSATVRGLLRWWWRALHAGFVDVATLRRMEAAIWGNTKAGGAVRVTVEPTHAVTPLPYDKSFIARMNKLPAPPNNKTTQGLWYHSYGMDEKKGRRWFLPSGTRWRLGLTVRRSQYTVSDGKDQPRKDAPELTAEVVLAQAQAALWLLCHLGGVGSKARKGFGSFADPPELSAWNMQTCEEQSALFRTACRLREQPFDPRRAETPALQQILPFQDTATDWQNVWLALDQVGDVVQRFAQGLKHNVEKKGLGLPRNVKPPVHGSFEAGAPVPKTGRHAAPIWFHLSKDAANNLVVRVTAFPARLPNLGASQTLLGELLKHLKTELPIRVRNSTGHTPALAVNPPTAGIAFTPAGGPTSGSESRIKTDSRVTVKVLETRQVGGKPAFKVQEQDRPPGMLMYGTPPTALPAEGDMIQVYRNNNDLRNPQYRWDPPSPPPSRASGQGKKRPRR